MSNLRYLPSSNHRQKFCLLGFSESWTWRRRRNFPLPWISSSWGHSELNEALSHSCRIVSHESWFCRKSPGTLLLCFYWRFMINQRREVLAKLWKQKKPLHFSASVSSLDEWMKPLRIDLKLVWRLPKIPILKSVWGFSVFRNSSPAMVSDVTCIGKILITKLNRKIARQPIGISKKQHTDLKTKPLRLTLGRSFICAVRFDTQLIRSTNHRPFRIVALESFYD